MVWVEEDIERKCNKYVHSNFVSLVSMSRKLRSTKEDKFEQGNIFERMEMKKLQMKLLGRWRTRSWRKIYGERR
jgi:hypothetical protein